MSMTYFNKTLLNLFIFLYKFRFCFYLQFFDFYLFFFFINCDRTETVNVIYTHIKYTLDLFSFTVKLLFASPSISQARQKKTTLKYCNRETFIVDSVTV